ncbi:MAG: DNA repair protein RecN [Clostridia bacterium]|nr:DNA repair protein RecN [Clostridia bacterium]
MIQSLKIQNFVLIDTLEIDFHAGMQVMTGETGAGKSIVVDAVNLVLGGRADRSLIRSGCEKASVEAVFDVPGNTDVAKVLARESIDYDGSTVSIFREMSAGGKNLCRVCGVIVSASLLREIGTYLMDIHGQHEHQFLMDSDQHLFFLDRMGDKEYQQLLGRTAEAYEAFLSVHRRYARLRRENDQKQRRMEELEKALRELHEAKLKPGEEETLQEENLRLRNAEKIASTLRLAREAITLGENEQSSLEKIKSASVALSSLNAYGDKMKNLTQRCESVYYELEEIAFEVFQCLEEMEHDPQRMEKTEERLDLIRKLERKYGDNLTKVLAEQARMEQEHEVLCSLEDQISDTAREHKQKLMAYRQLARELSDNRKALAQRFEKNMMEQLSDLGMEKTIFQVAFDQEGEKKPMPRPVGDDLVEFMISPNPGEPLRPLAKIASGGELSRMMLALKALEAEGSGVECMVFDEIDTGISGRMAQVVAEKMVAISQSKQVICVTHLPQIAAAADFQYLVAKEVTGERTTTSVKQLDREGRVREVARMISGAEGIGDDALAYAGTMIEAMKRKI